MTNLTLFISCKLDLYNQSYYSDKWPESTYTQLQKKVYTLLSYDYSKEMIPYNPKLGGTKAGTPKIHLRSATFWVLDKSKTAYFLLELSVDLKVF